MWDVVVVGAGPGGSLAAKQCAGQGMRTLLLEKRRLPRDKVCSGMIAGPLAQGTMREAFGEIPQEVLTPPYALSGQMFHVPGVVTKTLEWKTPVAWRKDLDYWMNQKTMEKGVQLWDRVRVVRVEQRGHRCRVLLEGKRKEEIQTRFVIGADGAGSLVRKFLFPELKVRYAVAIRECYRGALDMDGRYLHWFFPRSLPRPRFNVNHKGDCFLVEGSGVKELRAEITETLNNHGFNPKNEFLRRDACLIPLLHGELTSNSFSPARGNILLVGDAAGILLPMTFEGIGTAMKSGMLAAESILEAVSCGRDASGVYLGHLGFLIKAIKEVQDLGRRIEKEASKGAPELAEALKQGYEEALKVA